MATTIELSRDIEVAGAAIPSGTRHIRSLDGIRGIAVLLVLAVHFQNMAALPQTSTILRWAGSFMAWGWSGVDLFFVLSGFLITGILLDSRDCEGRYQRFYCRRIARIFPLYYAVVLLCLAACTAWKFFVSNEPIGPSPIGAVTYLLHLQNWWIPFAGLHKEAFLGPLWSLAIEEQFYLIWPVCVWTFSPKALTKICGAGIALAFLLRWCFTPYVASPLKYVIYMNTLTNMDGVLTGAFFAIAIRDVALLRRIRTLIPAAVSAVVLGLGLMVINGHQAWNDHHVLVYGHLLLTAGFGLLVLRAFLCDGRATLLDRVLRSRGLTTFGKYSYGIYVYQAFALELALHFWRHQPWWEHSTQYGVALALGWVIVPFLAAFLSYHLYEKHFLRLRPSLPASTPRWHLVGALSTPPEL